MVQKAHHEVQRCACNSHEKRTSPDAYKNVKSKVKSNLSSQKKAKINQKRVQERQRHDQEMLGSLSPGRRADNTYVGKRVGGYDLEQYSPSNDKIQSRIDACLSEIARKQKEIDSLRSELESAKPTESQSALQVDLEEQIVNPQSMAKFSGHRKSSAKASASPAKVAKKRSVVRNKPSF